MFIILTHDNQSILSLSFVKNSPVAEKALSSSTDVDLFVSKTGRPTVFQGYLASFL